jgi:hypothetical protein
MGNAGYRGRSKKKVKATNETKFRPRGCPDEAEKTLACDKRPKHADALPTLTPTPVYRCVWLLSWGSI